MSSTVLRLGKASVPPLCYCGQASPLSNSRLLKKNINKLEHGQRKETKLIKDLEINPYGEHLRELDIFTLVKRKIRSGTIVIFAYLTAYDMENVASTLFGDSEG